MDPCGCPVGAASWFVSNVTGSYNTTRRQHVPPIAFSLVAGIGADQPIKERSWRPSL